LIHNTDRNRVKINIDQILLPTKELKALLEAALNVTMPTAKRQVMSDMEKFGMRLDDDTAYYSLAQIRDYFHFTIGGNAAEIMADIIRNTLKRNGTFEKYS